MLGIAGSDARLLIRSAVPTAIAGAVAIVVGTLVAGGKGAVGALLGVLLVAVFFTISMVIVGWVSRVRPAALMPAAVGTFLAKILILLGLISAVNGTTAFNTKVFGFTAVACVLVWTGGQVATLAQRMQYVDPVPSVSPPRETGDHETGDHEAGGPDAAPGAIRQEHSVNTGGDQ